MRLANFLFNLSKIVVLIGFLAYGLKITNDGHLLTLKQPSPESPIYFQKTMHPPVGADAGIVNITLIPTQAFVIGDLLTAKIEVHVFGINWRENEPCMVDMLFPDAICYIDS